MPPSLRTGQWRRRPRAALTASKRKGSNPVPHGSRRSPIKGVFVASLLLAVGLLSAGSAQAAALPKLTLTITASSIRRDRHATVGWRERRDERHRRQGSERSPVPSEARRQRGGTRSRPQGPAPGRIRTKHPSTVRSPSTRKSLPATAAKSRRCWRPVSTSRWSLKNRRDRKLADLHGETRPQHRSRCRRPKRRFARSSSASPGPPRCTTASWSALKTKVSWFTWTSWFPAKSKSAAKQIVKGAAVRKGKGAWKSSSSRRTLRIRRAVVARSVPAGDDHSQAGLVCAGLLHGNPGWT